MVSKLEKLNSWEKMFSIGYFNNPALTKEKFSFKDGDRAYRTGDYGYFEDGMLFFVGRRDDLVKLHGFSCRNERD